MTASAGHLEAAELAAVPMLASVAPARLSRLAASCAPRRWPAGQVLFARGDPATRLLIVLHGRVSALVDHPDGSRSRYPLMYGPCVIDKASVLAGEPHRATWTAVSPGRGAMVSADVFRTLLAAEPGLRDHVLRYLAGQVGQGRAALASHAAARPVTLVARWLTAASDSGAQPLVFLPDGQQGLAEELGLSRVTVNRALRQLVRVGAIRTRPRVLVVLDPVRLSADEP